MKTFLVALTSILFSVAAQFLLKAGMSSPAVTERLLRPFSLTTVTTIFSNVFVLGGFLLYGLGAVVWLQVLSKWEVSKAYPLVGLGLMLSVMVGAVLGEQVTAMRVFGAALIAVGIWLIAQT